MPDKTDYVRPGASGHDISALICSECRKRPVMDRCDICEECWYARRAAVQDRGCWYCGGPLHDCGGIHEW